MKCCHPAESACPVSQGARVLLVLMPLMMDSLTGCGVPPVGADSATLRQVHLRATSSVLTGECSDATKVVVHRYDLEGWYASSPSAAIAYLHQKAQIDPRRDLLYALAELSYQYADDLARTQEPVINRQASDRFLSAAVYAYLYLLGTGAEPPPSPFDMRFRVACDLYNHALARSLASPEYEDRVVLAGGPRMLPAGSVDVQVRQPEFPWPIDDFDHFLAANQFLVRGLTVRNRQSPKNPLLLALAEVPLAPGVKGHSIIAVQTAGDPATGDDGVVKYTSAQMDGMESELIVTGPHSCQSKPAAIEEVRRILLEHLQTAP